MVRGARSKVTLNKPIAVGFCILEISKLVMYKFYYDVMKARYGERCSLLFTDTDSLCCAVRTHDIYDDFADVAGELDTSKFEKKYSLDNRPVLAKMKSETGSTAPKESVGLRAKIYSLWFTGEESKSFKKVKGIQSKYVKKKVRQEQFLDVLRKTKKDHRKISHVQVFQPRLADRGDDEIVLVRFRQQAIHLGRRRAHAGLRTLLAPQAGYVVVVLDERRVDPSSGATEPYDIRLVDVLVVAVAVVVRPILRP